MIEVVYNLFQAQNLATAYGLSYAAIEQPNKATANSKGINSVIKY